MNQHAALRINRRLLTVVVRSVKELSPSGIHCGEERKTLLDGFPFREGVNADVIAGKTSYVKFFAVFLFNQPTEGVGTFSRPLESIRAV